MDIQRTICLFGLELIGGKDEGTSAIVRIKVCDADHLVLGADGPVATVAISPDLMTTGEINHFLDSALAELEKLRVQANAALKRANPTMFPPT